MTTDLGPLQIRIDLLTENYNRKFAVVKEDVKQLERRVIAPKVDAKELHALNRLYDKKIAHHNEVVNHVKTNAIKPQVDPVNLLAGINQIRAFSAELERVKSEIGAMGGTIGTTVQQNVTVDFGRLDTRMAYEIRSLHNDMSKDFGKVVDAIVGLKPSLISRVASFGFKALTAPVRLAAGATNAVVGATAGNFIEGIFNQAGFSFANSVTSGVFKKHGKKAQGLVDSFFGELVDAGGRGLTTISEVTTGRRAEEAVGTFFDAIAKSLGAGLDPEASSRKLRNVFLDLLDRYSRTQVEPSHPDYVPMVDMVTQSILDFQKRFPVEVNNLLFRVLQAVNVPFNIAADMKMIDYRRMASKIASDVYVDTSGNIQRRSVSDPNFTPRGDLGPEYNKAVESFEFTLREVTKNFEKLKTAQNIWMVSHGFATESGYGSRKTVEQFRPFADQNTVLLPLMNNYTDKERGVGNAGSMLVPLLRQLLPKGLSEALLNDSLVSTLYNAEILTRFQMTGGNPDQIAMLAVNKLLSSNFPDATRTMLGFSGGGAVIAEAADASRQAGIPTKALAIGYSPAQMHPAKANHPDNLYLTHMADTATLPLTTSVPPAYVMGALQKSMPQMAAMMGLRFIQQGDRTIELDAIKSNTDGHNVPLYLGNPAVQARAREFVPGFVGGIDYDPGQFPDSVRKDPQFARVMRAQEESGVSAIFAREAGGLVKMMGSKQDITREASLAGRFFDLEETLSRLQSDYLNIATDQVHPKMIEFVRENFSGMVEHMSRLESFVNGWLIDKTTIKADAMPLYEAALPGVVTELKDLGQKENKLIKGKTEAEKRGDTAEAEKLAANLRLTQKRKEALVKQVVEFNEEIDKAIKSTDWGKSTVDAGEYVAAVLDRIAERLLTTVYGMAQDTFNAMPQRDRIRVAAVLNKRSEDDPKIQKGLEAIRQEQGETIEDPTFAEWSFYQKGDPSRYKYSMTGLIKVYQDMAADIRDQAGKRLIEDYLQYLKAVQAAIINYADYNVPIPDEILRSSKEVFVTGAKAVSDYIPKVTIQESFGKTTSALQPLSAEDVKKIAELNKQIDEFNAANPDRQVERFDSNEMRVIGQGQYSRALVSPTTGKVVKYAAQGDIEALKPAGEVAKEAIAFLNDFLGSPEFVRAITNLIPYLFPPKMDVGQSPDELYAEEIDFLKNKVTEALTHGVADQQFQGFQIVDLVKGKTLSGMILDLDAKDKDGLEGQIKDIQKALIKLGASLNAVNRAGVGHRDMHISNAMMDESGDLIAIDFGKAEDIAYFDDRGKILENYNRAVTRSISIIKSLYEKKRIGSAEYEALEKAFGKNFEMLESLIRLGYNDPLLTPRQYTEFERSAVNSARPVMEQRRNTFPAEFAQQLPGQAVLQNINVPPELIEYAEYLQATIKQEGRPKQSATSKQNTLGELGRQFPEGVNWLMLTREQQSIVQKSAEQVAKRLNKNSFGTKVKDYYDKLIETEETALAPLLTGNVPSFLKDPAQKYIATIKKFSEKIGRSISDRNYEIDAKDVIDFLDVLQNIKIEVPQSSYDEVAHLEHLLDIAAKDRDRQIRENPEGRQVAAASNDAWKRPNPLSAVMESGYAQEQAVMPVDTDLLSVLVDLGGETNDLLKAILAQLTSGGGGGGATAVTGNGGPGGGGAPQTELVPAGGGGPSPSSSPAGALSFNRLTPSELATRINMAVFEGSDAVRRFVSEMLKLEDAVVSKFWKGREVLAAAKVVVGGLAIGGTMAEVGVLDDYILLVQAVFQDVFTKIAEQGADVLVQNIADDTSGVINLFRDIAGTALQPDATGPLAGIRNQLTGFQLEVIQSLLDMVDNATQDAAAVVELTLRGVGQLAAQIGGQGTGAVAGALGLGGAGAFAGGAMKSVVDGLENRPLVTAPAEEQRVPLPRLMPKNSPLSNPERAQSLFYSGRAQYYNIQSVLKSPDKSQDDLLRALYGNRGYRQGLGELASMYSKQPDAMPPLTTVKGNPAKSSYNSVVGLAGNYQKQFKQIIKEVVDLDEAGTVIDDAIIGILLKEAKKAGIAIPEGLGGGIASYAGKPIDEQRKLARKLLEEFKAFFKISSPSKVYEVFGRQIVEGLDKGLEGFTGTLEEKRELLENYVKALASLKDDGLLYLSHWTNNGVPGILKEGILDTGTLRERGLSHRAVNNEREAFGDYVAYAVPTFADKQYAFSYQGENEVLIDPQAVKDRTTFLTYDSGGGTGLRKGEKPLPLSEFTRETADSVKMGYPEAQIKGGVRKDEIIGINFGDLAQRYEWEGQELIRLITATLSAGIPVFGKNAEKLGGQLGEGLAKGIYSTDQIAELAAINSALSLIDAVKKAYGIKSPSTVFIAIGKQNVAGEIEGVRQAKPALIKEYVKLAEDAFLVYTATAQGLVAGMEMVTLPVSKYPDVKGMLPTAPQAGPAVAAFKEQYPTPLEYLEANKGKYRDTNHESLSSLMYADKSDRIAQQHGWTQEAKQKITGYLDELKRLKKEIAEQEAILAKPALGDPSQVEKLDGYIKTQQKSIKSDGGFVASARKRVAKYQDMLSEPDGKFGKETKYEYAQRRILQEEETIQRRLDSIAKSKQNIIGYVGKKREALSYIPAEQQVERFWATQKSKQAQEEIGRIQDNLIPWEQTRIRDYHSNIAGLKQESLREREQARLRIKPDVIADYGADLNRAFAVDNNGIDPQSYPAQLKEAQATLRRDLAEYYKVKRVRQSAFDSGQLGTKSPYSTLIESEALRVNDSPAMGSNRQFGLRYALEAYFDLLASSIRPVVEDLLETDPRIDVSPEMRAIMDELKGGVVNHLKEMVVIGQNSVLEYELTPSAEVLGAKVVFRPESLALDDSTYVGQAKQYNTDLDYTYRLQQAVKQNQPVEPIIQEFAMTRPDYSPNTFLMESRWNEESFAVAAPKTQAYASQLAKSMDAAEGRLIKMIEEVASLPFGEGLKRLKTIDSKNFKPTTGLDEVKLFGEDVPNQDRRAARAATLFGLAGQFSQMKGFEKARAVATVPVDVLLEIKNLNKSLDPVVVEVKQRLSAMMGKVGLDAAIGYALGMEKGKGEVVGATKETIGASPEAAQQELQIKSPSKVYMRIGDDAILGFIISVERGIEDIKRMSIGAPELNDGEWRNIEDFASGIGLLTAKIRSREGFSGRGVDYLAKSYLEADAMGASDADLRQLMPRSVVKYLANVASATTPTAPTAVLNSTSQEASSVSNAANTVAEGLSAVAEEAVSAAEALGDLEQEASGEHPGRNLLPPEQERQQPDRQLVPPSSVRASSQSPAEKRLNRLFQGIVALKAELARFGLSLSDIDDFANKALQAAREVGGDAGLELSDLPVNFEQIKYVTRHIKDGLAEFGLSLEDVAKMTGDEFNALAGQVQQLATPPVRAGANVTALLGSLPAGAPSTAPPAAVANPRSGFAAFSTRANQVTAAAAGGSGGGTTPPTANAAASPAPGSPGGSGAGSGSATTPSSVTQSVEDRRRVMERAFDAIVEAIRNLDPRAINTFLDAINGAMDALDGVAAESGEIVKGLVRSFEAFGDQHPTLRRMANVIKEVGLGVLFWLGWNQVDQILVDFGRAAIDAALKMERFKVALSYDTSTGGMAGLERIRNMADDIGANFLAVADSYTKLTIAAANTNLAPQVERITTGFTKALTAQGATPDEQMRAFLAVEQMIGKNQIMAEELRQQLAEVMPQVPGALARSRGVTQQQLVREMKNTPIMPEEALLPLAMQLEAEATVPLATYQEGPLPKIAAVQNQVVQLQAGFGETLLNLGNSFEVFGKKIGVLDLTTAALKGLNAVIGPVSMAALTLGGLLGLQVVGGLAAFATGTRIVTLLVKAMGLEFLTNNWILTGYTKVLGNTGLATSAAARGLMGVASAVGTLTAAMVPLVAIAAGFKIFGEVWASQNTELKKMVDQIKEAADQMERLRKEKDKLGGKNTDTPDGWEQPNFWTAPSGSQPKDQIPNQTVVMRDALQFGFSLLGIGKIKDERGNERAARDVLESQTNDREIQRLLVEGPRAIDGIREKMTPETLSKFYNDLTANQLERMNLETELANVPLSDTSGAAYDRIQQQIAGLAEERAQIVGRFGRNTVQLESIVEVYKQAYKTLELNADGKPDEERIPIMKLLSSEIAKANSLIKILNDAAAGINKNALAIKAANEYLQTSVANALKMTERQAAQVEAGAMRGYVNQPGRSGLDDFELGYTRQVIAEQKAFSDYNSTSDARQQLKTNIASTEQFDAQARSVLGKDAFRDNAQVKAYLSGGGDVFTAIESLDQAQLAKFKETAGNSGFAQMYDNMIAYLDAVDAFNNAQSAYLNAAEQRVRAEQQRLIYLRNAQRSIAASNTSTRLTASFNAGRIGEPELAYLNAVAQAKDAKIKLDDDLKELDFGKTDKVAAQEEVAKSRAAYQAAEQQVIQAQRSMQDAIRGQAISVEDYNQAVYDNTVSFTRQVQDYQWEVEDSYRSMVKGVRDLQESWADLMFGLESKLLDARNDLAAAQENLAKSQRRLAVEQISPFSESYAKKAATIIADYLDALDGNEAEARSLDKQQREIGKEYVDTLRNIRNEVEKQLEAEIERNRTLIRLNQKYMDLVTSVDKAIRDIQRRAEELGINLSRNAPGLKDQMSAPNQRPVLPSAGASPEITGINGRPVVYGYPQTPTAGYLPASPPSLSSLPGGSLPTVTGQPRGEWVFTQSGPAPVVPINPHEVTPAPVQEQPVPPSAVAPPVPPTPPAKPAFLMGPLGGLGDDTGLRRLEEHYGFETMPDYGLPPRPADAPRPNPNDPPYIRYGAAVVPQIRQRQTENWYAAPQPPAPPPVPTPKPKPVAPPPAVINTSPRELTAPAPVVKPQIQSAIPFSLSGQQQLLLAAFDPVLKTIRKAEGGFASFNRGRSGDSKGQTLETLFGKPLSQITVNEIMAKQRAGQVRAVGAYQMVPSTLAGAAQRTGLGNAPFTPEVQGLLAIDLATNKQPQIAQYIKGVINDIIAAAVAGSKEWAGIGVPVAMQGHKRPVQAGQSYYSGVANNAANVSGQDFMRALEQSRIFYEQLRQTHNLQSKLNFALPSSSIEVGRLASGVTDMQAPLLMAQDYPLIAPSPAPTRQPVRIEEPLKNYPLNVPREQAPTPTIPVRPVQTTPVTGQSKTRFPSIDPNAIYELPTEEIGKSRIQFQPKPVITLPSLPAGAFQSPGEFGTQDARPAQNMAAETLRTQQATVATNRQRLAVDAERFFTDFENGVANLMFEFESAQRGRTREIRDNKFQMTQMTIDSKGFQTGADQILLAGEEIKKKFLQIRDAAEERQAEIGKKLGQDALEIKQLEALIASGKTKEGKPLTEQELAAMNSLLSATKAHSEELRSQATELDAQTNYMLGLADATRAATMEEMRRQKVLEGQQAYANKAAEFYQTRYDVGAQNDWGIGTFINPAPVIKARMDAVAAMDSLRKLQQDNILTPDAFAQLSKFQEQINGLNIKRSFVEAIPGLQAFSSELKSAILESNSLGDSLKKVANVVLGMILEQGAIKPFQNLIAEWVGPMLGFEDASTYPVATTMGAGYAGKSAQVVPPQPAAEAVNNIVPYTAVLGETTTATQTLATTITDASFSQEAAATTFTGALYQATQAVVAFAGALQTASATSVVSSTSGGGLGGILGTALNVGSSIFGSPADFLGGTNFAIDSSVSLPTFADGADNVHPLLAGINQAFGKELGLSGKQPYLAVLHEGEAVLSTRNKDAELYRDLKSNGHWEQLKKQKVEVNTFAYGTPTPTRNFTQQRTQTSGEVSHNYYSTTTINVQKPNDIGLTARQVERQNRLNAERSLR